MRWSFYKAILVRRSLEEFRNLYGCTAVFVAIRFREH